MRSGWALWCALAGAAALVLGATGVNAQTNGVGTQFELTFWQSVDDSNDPAMYEAYLAKYPDGTFAPLARAKIAMLRKGQPAGASAAASPASVPAPPPPPPPPAPPAPVVALPAEPPRPAAPQVATPQLASAAPLSAAPLPAAPAPAPAAQLATPQADQPSTLGALLAALAQTQDSGARSGNPALAVPAPAGPAAGVAAPLSAGFALPQRPQLVPVPPLAMPPSFCSAEARNAFHDGAYTAAIDAARRNNEAAVAYMKRIQSLYDGYRASDDANSMNALAAEAREWQPQAAQAFAVQDALVRRFDELMAVPIVHCGPAR